MHTGVKKCKICEREFTPQYSTAQRVCGTKCAMELARGNRQKKAKKETTRMRREFNLKDRSYQLKLAQAAFNAYIRERDPQSKGCISCGGTTGKWTAGHYKTDKSLRFVEDNCHGQCWFNCNSNKSGNIAEYRPRLVEKIGIERVEALETYHPPPKLTIEEIIEIKELYRAKLKALADKG